MCKVTWCETEPLKYLNGNSKAYCATHVQYKQYASNAPSRPWLMYKVEKVVANKLQCEKCGYDAKVFHPNRPTNELAGLFDVDHIISDMKYTPEGEQPSNYQLLCKQCHILKSYDEGDFISKNNR
jgi:5-methylcytosine-specific restriction endonuclease McrA